MDYESSDILGSNSLPVRDPGSQKWSGFSKTAFFLALLLAAYVGGVRAWNALLKWREKAYRLSMRRRHGIPDNDHRPFNVAYAAVLRARREEDVANNRVHRVDVDELYAQADQHAAQVESNLRQRNNQYRNPEPVPINGLPGRFNPLVADSSRFPASSGLPPSSSHTINFAERYDPNPPPPPAPAVVRFADEIEDASLPRRSSIANLNNSPRKHQKRALEEYEAQLDVPENIKKTRVEGDEFIDGDEDAGWLPRQKRGEKRVMQDDDLEEQDAGKHDTRVRGKRARKVSLEEPDVFMSDDDNADDMDVDEDGDWSQTTATRGKKRDAGAIFDGEEENDDNQVQKTKRKRRTRKSDAATAQRPSRGQKRDRDGDEEGSDAEVPVPGPSTAISRKTKKRGKKNKEVAEDIDEGLTEDSVAKGKGRSIGEEWESNGVLYKIGPNGQRLRQALVKKAARRFVMPTDSQHPDKNANLEVCIETWLAEEEYNDLKTRHLLAWQDSPKGTQEPESVPSTPAAVEAPATPTPNPVPRGKNLLWDSPASPFPVFAPSPAEKEQQRPKAHFRQSIAADLGVRVNPFEKANALHVGAEIAKNGLRATGRRVVAAREIGPSLLGLADSTNNVGSQTPLARRTFSKWEKQDLEAKAMMKMREANLAKVREKELLKEKLENEKKQAAAAAAAPVPAITLSKPPEISCTPAAPSAGAPATKPSSFSFATPASAAPPKQPLEPPAAANKPQQAAASNLFEPPASAAPAASSSSSIPNPFAKPSPAPPSTAASTTSSNPLAPPPLGAAPSATTAPSFSFAPAQPAAPKAPTPAPSKPAESPFGPPNPAAPPTFSFAPPAQKENPPPSASGTQSQPQGGSLLSRMGGVAAKPAEASSSTAPPPLFSFKPATESAAPQPPKPAETSSAAPPLFSFKSAADPAASKSAFAASQPQPPKPAETSAAPPTFSFKPAAAAADSAAPPKPAGSVFSFKPAAAVEQQSTTPTQPAAKQDAAAASANKAPQFSFGFGGVNFTAPSSTATPSSLTGALGSSDAKPGAGAPAPPTFSFKPAEKPATTPGFGGFQTGTGAPSAFGASAAGQGEQKKNGFSFGGAAATGGANPSPFGSTAFGGGAGASAFGGGGFGSSAPRPAEKAPKAAPAAGAGTTTAPASTPASGAPTFNFAFGGNSTASTTPAATPGASANPFAAKPSAFGGPSIFGKPAAEASTTPQGSPFGGAPSAFGAAASTTPTPSPFGAKPDVAAPASPFGAPANTTTSSIFGNAAAQGPSAFGFGKS